MITTVIETLAYLLNLQGPECKLTPSCSFRYRITQQEQNRIYKIIVFWSAKSRKGAYRRKYFKVMCRPIRTSIFEIKYS